jgi:PleD family two-component response regulator
LTFTNRSDGGFTVGALLARSPPSKAALLVGGKSRSMKILIVDDHPIVRSGLRRLLAPEAEEIQGAATGQLALSIFRASRPTVTVLDLNLPGISGLEVIERLRIVDPNARILAGTLPEYDGKGLM